MTFEQWKEGEQWNDHCNPTAFAKAAWEYQQKRIDELERWIAGIADDHPQIPDWIQQSARSLLAQEGE